MRSISLLLLVSYFTNIFYTATFYVFFGLTTLSVEFAQAAMPVNIITTCPSGYTLYGGQCTKTLSEALTKQCPSGFNMTVVGGRETCQRNEYTPATPVCPVDYSPEVADPPLWCIENNPPQNNDPNVIPEPDIVPVESYHCPVDDPHAAPQPIEQSCKGEDYVKAACEAEHGSGSVTEYTPDQRWSLNNSNKMCYRSVYEGIIEECPAGYTQEATTCIRIEQVPPTQECPAGHEEMAGQCYEGGAPQCNAGLTYNVQSGYCESANNYECAIGLEKDSTGSCIKPQGSQTDFEYGYESGADLARLIAGNVLIPDIEANGNTSVEPSVLDPTIELNRSAYSGIQTLGKDVDKDIHFSPSGTYQNEENQTALVNNSIDSFNTYLKDDDPEKSNSSADAYGAVIGTIDNNPPSTIDENDSIFLSGNQALIDANQSQGEYFGDCTADSVSVTKLDPDKIITTSYECFKPNQANYSGCVIDRVVIEPATTVVSSSVTGDIEDCPGEKNCLIFTIGTKRDRIFNGNGSCNIHNQDVQFSLREGFTVTNAEVIDGAHTGSMTISLGHSNIPIYGLAGVQNPTQNCQSNSETSVGNTNITDLVRDEFEKEQTLIFNYKLGVGGGANNYGNGYAKVKVNLSSETSVTLTEWQQKGTSNHWNVENDVATQSSNVGSNLLLSPNPYTETQLRSKFNVGASADSNGVGVVFGYPDYHKDINAQDTSFYIVTWLKNQSRLVLARVSSGLDVLPSNLLSNSANYQIIRSVYATGWIEDFEHHMTLDVRQDRVEVLLDGQVVLNETLSNTAGRIGIYTHQQGDVKFSNVTASDGSVLSSRWTEEITQSPPGCIDNIADPAKYCTSGPFTCDDSILWNDIDMSDWETYDTNGAWDIDLEPGSVIQKINGDETSFISKRVYDFNSFRGKIMADDQNSSWNTGTMKVPDNDWIGFVFGYDDETVINQDDVDENGALPVTDPTVDDDEFYIFMWRKGADNNGPFLQLQRRINDSKMYAGWSTQAPNVQVLASNNSVQWEAKRDHDFRINITSTKIEVFIDEVKRIEATGTFGKGRVGFFNSSQSGVRYKQVQDLYPDGLGEDAADGYIFNPLTSEDTGYPVCMSAHQADYFCDPLEGRKLNIEGVEFSSKDVLSLPNECENTSQQPANATCSVTNQTCAEGWYDEVANICYAWNMTYTCDDATNAMVTTTEDNNLCYDDVPCMSGECDVRPDETNDDFINALTQYSAINEMATDAECSDPNDLSTCVVFGGESKYCGWDQLKVNDCCKMSSTDPIDLFKASAYMAVGVGYTASSTGIFSKTALNESLNNGYDAVATATEGAWNSVKDPIVDAGTKAVDYASSFFTSNADNLAGTADGAIVDGTGATTSLFGEGAVMEGLEVFKDEILSYIYELLPDVIQEALKAATNALSSFMGTEALGSDAVGADVLNHLGGNLITVVQFAGWVYAGYQLAKMAYTMLTACDDEEMVMKDYLAEKKCFFTRHKPCKKVFGVCTSRAKNYYCCFDSMLSRLIMEQSLTQLGIGKEAYRATRNCKGITLDEMANLDFSLIDFSEWTEMMQRAELMPENETMDSITGDNFSNGYGRDNTLERMDDRGGQTDFIDERNAIEEGEVLRGVNCETRPRPASCDIITNR